MAKINATYSSGYYISPDTDFRKLEEQQANEKKSLRKRGRDGDGADDPEALRANTKRQTFAIPFDLYCNHCERRIPRGAHVYTNRRPTRMKYLNAIRIWELEIRCQYCSSLYYLQTDPETPKETGGYKCVKHCHRAEGDFLALNEKNAAAKAQWEKEKAEAEANPLAALERENEASRELAERNRRIEEDVLARADAGDDAALLAAMRRRRQQRTEGGDASTGTSGDLPSFSSSKYSLDPLAGEGDDGDAVDGNGGELNLSPEELAAEEAAYAQFEAEMYARWQEAQSLAAKQQRRSAGDGEHWGGPDWLQPTTQDGGPDAAVHAEELAVALSRYGGGALRGDSSSSTASSSLSSSNLALSSARLSPPASLPGKTKNAFVTPDSGSDSGEEEGNASTRTSSGGNNGNGKARLLSTARPKGPAQTAAPARQKKPSLLSSMFGNDSDDD